MKKGLAALAIWLLTFAAVYVAMVLVNSLGAHFQDQSASYGSSRLYQEISGFAHLLVHVIPALCVGFFVPRLAWQVSGILSLIAEISGNLDLFGKQGLPYIGDPLASIVTYALIGMLSAYWMRIMREKKATRAPA
jgi:hypothetical protein